MRQRRTVFRLLRERAAAARNPRDRRAASDLVYGLTRLMEVDPSIFRGRLSMLQGLREQALAVEATHDPLKVQQLISAFNAFLGEEMQEAENTLQNQAQGEREAAAAAAQAQADAEAAAQQPPAPGAGAVAGAGAGTASGPQIEDQAGHQPPNGAAPPGEQGAAPAAAGAPGQPPAPGQPAPGAPPPAAAAPAAPGAPPTAAAPGAPPAPNAKPAPGAPPAPNTPPAAAGQKQEATMPMPAELEGDGEKKNKPPWVEAGDGEEEEEVSADAAEQAAATAPPPGAPPTAHQEGGGAEMTTCEACGHQQSKTSTNTTMQEAARTTGKPLQESERGELSRLRAEAAERTRAAAASAAIEAAGFTGYLTPDQLTPFMEAQWPTMIRALATPGGRPLSMSARGGVAPRPRATGGGVPSAAPAVSRFRESLGGGDKLSALFAPPAPAAAAPAAK